MRGVRLRGGHEGAKVAREAQHVEHVGLVAPLDARHLRQPLLVDLRRRERGGGVVGKAVGVDGAPVTAPGQPEAARRGARGGRVLRVHERSEARDGREARLRGRRGAVGETAGGGQLRDERCDLPRRRARRLVPPTRAPWRVRLHGAGAEQRLCLGRPAGVVAGSRHCSGGGRGGRRRFERAGERGQLGAGGAQHRLARHAAGGHARSQQLHVLRDLLRELLQPAHERRLPRLTLGQPVQRLEEIIVDASVADAVDGVQVAAQLEGAQLRRHVVDEELQVHGVHH